jgi:hypothetical protein
MLMLPGGGHIGLRYHVARQDFGQNLRVQAVGLLGGLSDDSELAGIGQHDFLGNRLQERDEPVLLAVASTTTLKGWECRKNSAMSSGRSQYRVFRARALNLSFEHAVLIISKACSSRPRPCSVTDHSPRCRYQVVFLGFDRLARGLVTLRHRNATPSPDHCRTGPGRIRCTR